MTGVCYEELCSHHLYCRASLSVGTVRSVSSLCVCVCVVESFPLSVVFVIVTVLITNCLIFQLIESWDTVLFSLAEQLVSDNICSVCLCIISEIATLILLSLRSLKEHIFMLFCHYFILSCPVQTCSYSACLWTCHLIHSQITLSLIHCSLHGKLSNWASCAKQYFWDFGRQWFDNFAPLFWSTYYISICEK